MRSHVHPPKVTACSVRRVLEDPPDFLAMSYLPAWRAGRLSTEGMAGAVVAAMGMRPYRDARVVDEVTGILEGLGYGDEPASVLFV